jgi:hypothetical protein
MFQRALSPLPSGVDGKSVDWDNSYFKIYGSGSTSFTITYPQSVDACIFDSLYNDVTPMKSSQIVGRGESKTISSTYGGMTVSLSADGLTATVSGSMAYYAYIIGLKYL